MLVVRAIRENDTEGLLDLVRQVGFGMTTLKPDRDALSARVAIACASFAEQIPAPQRDYLFVMEDSGSGRIVGVCAIKAAVGLEEPFYNYRIGTLVHSSNELRVFSRMDTLYLSNDLTGCAELCSLFLHPDYRSGTNGKLLSKSRFMFMAQFPHLFPEKLIAEMRGYQRADGTSPFWDSLGHHFFKMDFSRADDLSALGKKSFIAELMPRHPLYVAYLPQEAQEVIGVVHVDTAPARKLLEQEGMHYEGYVDIFDAGPVLQSRVSELRAFRDSELVLPEVVEEQDDKQDEEQRGPSLVANTALRDFRVIVAGASPGQGRLRMTPGQQALLACGSGGSSSSTSSGDVVRTMSLNPRKPAHA
jgi:arginine N-succinyltransferase